MTLSTSYITAIEGGSNASFSVVLDSRPSSAVTVVIRVATLDDFGTDLVIGGVNDIAVESTSNETYAELDGGESPAGSYQGSYVGGSYSNRRELTASYAGSYDAIVSSTPTQMPTKIPTKAPTKVPTDVPTNVPTKAPKKENCTTNQQIVICNNILEFTPEDWSHPQMVTRHFVCIDDPHCFLIFAGQGVCI